MTLMLKLPKDQLSALRFEDVQLHLASRGWQHDAEASREGVGVYRFPTEPDAEVLLPLRRDWPDYPSRLADAVTTLAAVEQRPVWEVLNDLSTPPGDVLRLRVAAPDSSLGTLPLEEGLKLLRGGHDLLLAAACSAHQPQAYHPRQSFSQAQEFLQVCRMGQTERGSYVATIIAPVPPAIDPAPFPELEEEFQIAAEPYARRVTLRLMSSLRFVREAIQASALGRILDGVSEGVSADLCEALASMSPSSSQAKMDISINWARTRRRVPTSLPQSVSFAQGEFAIIQEAGRLLREGPPPKRHRTVGFIVNLHGETSLFEGFEGRVVLRGEVNGRVASIKFSLNREDYVRACDAYRDGRRVAVVGVLHRDAKMKMYDLLDPRNFEVLAEPVAAP